MAVQPDGFHEDPLVHAHRPQTGGFADDGMTGVRSLQFEQCAGTCHGGFLVGGGQQDDRTVQIPRAQRAYRLDRQCEKGFHVGGAETVQALVRLRQAKRVVLPLPLVERYRIGMPGQHQAARPLAERGDQVGPRRLTRQGQDLHREPAVLQPARQPFDHRQVPLVQGGIDRTDRRRADQRSEHVEQGRAGVHRCMRAVT